jgi:hypothetical protein
VFLAIYQWRAKPGKEAQFREAWRRGTQAIARKYASYGSRLCQTADGRFIGVAEWPDEASWRAAMAEGMAYDDDEARAMLHDATLDGGAPILAMPVLDDELTDRDGGGDA